MYAITLRMNTYRGRIIGGGASYLVAKLKTWRDRLTQSPK